MPLLTRRGAATPAVLSLTVLALAAALAGCGSSPAPTTPAPTSLTPAPQTPAVPAQLAVPAGQHLVLTATVQQGSQVYACHGTAWTLKQPAAVLVAPTTDVLHEAGPRWTATVDGSSVTAAQVAAAPVPGAASDLLLRATGHDGQGVMSTVDLVQRLGVRGGAAPAGTCVDGTQQAVGYTAEYRFYAPASS